MCEGGPGLNWTASRRIGATATYACAWHRDGHSTKRPTQTGSLTGERNKPPLTDYICHVGWPSPSHPQKRALLFLSSIRLKKKKRSEHHPLGRLSLFYNLQIRKWSLRIQMLGVTQLVTHKDVSPAQGILTLTSSSPSFSTRWPQSLSSLGDMRGQHFFCPGQLWRGKFSSL